MANFSREILYWGPYWSSKHFFICTIEFFLLRSLIWVPIWLNFEPWFFDQKVRQLVKTQKFCHHHLQRFTFSRGLILLFVIWLLRKLAFFGVFLDLLMENYRWYLLAVLGKYFYLGQSNKKCTQKYLVFRKCKNSTFGSSWMSIGGFSNGFLHRARCLFPKFTYESQGPTNALRFFSSFSPSRRVFWILRPTWEFTKEIKL